jgi:hypothetical protein
MKKEIITNKIFSQIKSNPPIKPDDTKSSTTYSGMIPVFIIGKQNEKTSS